MLVDDVAALSACASLHFIACHGEPGHAPQRRRCCRKLSAVYACAAQAVVVLPAAAVAIAAAGPQHRLAASAAAIASACSAAAAALALPLMPMRIGFVPALATAALVAQSASGLVPAAVVCAEACMLAAVVQLCVTPKAVSSLVAHRRTITPVHPYGCCTFVKSVGSALLPLGMFRDAFVVCRMQAVYQMQQQMQSSMLCGEICEADI